MSTPTNARHHVLIIDVCQPTLDGLGGALARAGVVVAGHAGGVEELLARPLDGLPRVDLLIVGPTADQATQAARCHALRTHFGVPVAVLAASAPAGLAFEQAPSIDASLALSAGVDAVSSQIPPIIRRVTPPRPAGRLSRLSDRLRRGFDEARRAVLESTPTWVGVMG